MPLLNLLVFGTAAMILHEIGHVVFAVLLDVKVHRVGVSRRGLFIHRECGSARRNLAITLAGPGTNLILAAMFSGHRPDFVLCNFTVGVINLLPIPASDGLRALRLVRSLMARGRMQAAADSNALLADSKVK